MSLRYTRVPSGLLDGLREAGSVGPTIQAVNTANLYRRFEAMVLGIDTFYDNAGVFANEWSDRKYGLQPYVAGATSRTFVSTGHTKFADPRFFVSLLVVGNHNRFVPTDLHAVWEAPAEGLNKFVAEGVVNITIDATQNGSTVGSVTSTNNVVNYWPANFSDVSPYLQNMAALRTDAAGEAALGYRAGLLDVGKGTGADVDLMEVLSMSFDSAGFDRSQPCGFEVTIEQVAAGVYPQWGPDSDLQSPEDAITIAQLRIDVVGFSVFAQTRL